MYWSVIYAAIAFAGFGVMTRLWPCNPGQSRALGRDFRVDLTYFLVSMLIYGGVTAGAAKLILMVSTGADADRLLAAILAGHGAMSRLPLLVQAFLIILVTDVIQYWLHRAFHTGLLWPFHAVHHSPKQIDWTATFRIHPINFLFYNTLAGALMLLLGFSPMAFAIVGPFNFFTAAMVHANLNWTFGPLKYVFASPVFHRWHHADDPAIYNKNFAPTFSFLDVMFGTFHMPEGRLPEAYGAEGVPEDFFGQLVYPFRAILAPVGRDASSGTPEAPARP
jgi:sterol desaturase/sphingolipid hydroxylase (fatty acid hydroxylase superfamily)